MSMRNSGVAESFYSNPSHDCKGSNFFVEEGVLYSYGKHFPVAVPLDGGYFLLNGDTYSVTTSAHQGEARYVIPESEQIIIPFSALMRALGLTSRIYYYWDKIKQINVIDVQKSTEIPYTYTDKEGNEKTGYHHTLGGSVFEYNGRYFISGIDSTSAKRAYFLTELKRSVEDFEDALEALKPGIVIDAESNGIEVRRQGEWFFIKLDNVTFENATKDGVLPDGSGNGGHHNVSELAKKGEALYVRGVVKHSRKDHKQLKLYDDVKQKKWWVAAMNEQLGSWSAGGNVD